MTQKAYHILSLFPEILTPYFATSILGRAQKSGLISIHCHQLRDYALDKHRCVDDRPFGGGPGMIFKPDVVVGAVRDLKERYGIERVFLTSPRGTPFNYSVAQRISQYHSILLICGRYEGIDQRAIDLVVDEEISIGDYVITGGELAAQVIIDASARLIPGVLSKEEALAMESHTHGSLEHPQYTRPAEFEGKKVPAVLLSGNHEAIEKWKRENLK